MLSRYLVFFFLTSQKTFIIAYIINRILKLNSEGFSDASWAAFDCQQKINPPGNHFIEGLPWFADKLSSVSVAL